MVSSIRQPLKALRVSSKLVIALGFSLSSVAADEDIQAKFNLKYRDFLSQSSQSLLPLPQLSKTDWKKTLETRPLKALYVEPDRFYNNKTYTFTMYRATDDGSYFLDVKGGFWGMDELVYGPMSGVEWQ